MPPTQTVDILTEWAALCADPRFHDTPHKVELTGRGKIIMSPTNNQHSQAQTAVLALFLSLQDEGSAFVEYALETDDGIRSPDVVWCSPKWLAEHRDEPVASSAPEICVEVMSPSNTLAEMEQKRDLYFRRGCREFILVDRKHLVTFFSPEGQLDESQVAPGFPVKLAMP